MLRETRDSFTFVIGEGGLYLHFCQKGKRNFIDNFKREKSCIETRILGDRREKGKQGLVLGDTATLFFVMNTQSNMSF